MKEETKTNCVRRGFRERSSRIRASKTPTNFWRAQAGFHVLKILEDKTLK